MQRWHFLSYPSGIRMKAYDFLGQSDTPTRDCDPGTWTSDKETDKWWNSIPAHGKGGLAMATMWLQCPVVGFMDNLAMGEPWQAGFSCLTPWCLLLFNHIYPCGQGPDIFATDKIFVWVNQIRLLLHAFRKLKQYMERRKVSYAL